MVDVIKATGIEYIASNPGSSFRSLQESIVNYGDNKKPEFLTCMHEESSVAMAHGYAKAAGKPMGMMAHGTVGLQHAAMAVYNAWCDRVPVVMFAGNFLDANKRRPDSNGITACRILARCYVTLPSGTTSRYRSSTSPSRLCAPIKSPPPCPWVLCSLPPMATWRKNRCTTRKNSVFPSSPSRSHRRVTAARLAKPPRLLAAAENPVILADRASRSQEGINRLVELAEALNAPVVDIGGRMNFPTNALSLSQRRPSRISGPG